MAERSSLARSDYYIECRKMSYATAAEAVAEVFNRDSNAVAYRCALCQRCHVAPLRGDRHGMINVPRLMAEGRFIAG